MTMKIGPFTVERRSRPTDADELVQLQKLFAAARQDDLPALQNLLSEGLDIQLRDEKMHTLLHLAHRGDTVTFLLQCKCDPLALDIEQSTTLMHPGLDAEANRLLLAHGVNLHARDLHGHTALYRQCDFSGIGWDNPDLEALQVLLAEGIARGNQDEIETIIEIAAQRVTSAGENNDVATLARFLRKYEPPGG